MTRHIWTNEQIKYLKKIAEGTPRKVIVDKINKKFNLSLTLSQLNNCMGANNIKTNTKHVWTDEQVEYLKSIAEGTPRKYIVEKLKSANEENYYSYEIEDIGRNLISVGNSLIMYIRHLERY